MHCRNFSNPITRNGGVRLWTNSTLEFPHFLKPTLESLLLIVDNYLRYGEGKLFEKLQHPCTLTDAKDLIANTKLPMAYLIVLTVCVLLILIAVPFVCFVNRYEGISDAKKTQYRFGLETLALIFSVVWIFVGISIYLPVANVLYASVQEYPGVIRRMIQNINSSIYDYKVQVDDFDVEINRAREEIATDIGSLPRFVAESVMDFVKMDVNIILGSFAQVEEILNFDVATLCTELNQTLSDYKNEIAELFSVRKFGQQLETAFRRSSQKELSLVVDVVLSNYGKESPLTAKVSAALQGLKGPLIWLDESVGMFQNAIEKTNLLSVYGFDMTVLRIITLFPVIYSGAFLSSLAVGIFHGLRHLKEQLRTKTYLGKLDVTISILNFTMKFSLFFLWMMFLIAGIIYLLFWPMAIVCRSLGDGTVYSKYLDEENIWNNSTWLDMVLEDDLQLGKTSVEFLMNACENNMTVVTALKINRTTIEDYYTIPISINLTSLEEAFNKSLDSISLLKPEEFSSMINRVERISKPPCHSLSKGEIQAYTLNLEKVKAIIIATEIYNEHLTRKLYGLKYEWNKSLFQNVSSSIACTVDNYKKYVNFMVNNKIGNCYVIPYTARQIRSLTCDHFLFVLMALLISTTIISFSTLIAVIILLRVTNYVRGVIQFYKCAEFSERYSSEQSRSIALCKK